MLLLRLLCTKSNTTPLLPSPISTSYTAIIRSSPYSFSLPFPGRQCPLRKKKKRKFISNCREKQRQDHEGEEPISRASPYEILGVEPTSSLADLKSAFRDKVTANPKNYSLPTHFHFLFVACCVLGLVRVTL